MLISSYNVAAMGDILVLLMAQATTPTTNKQVGDVVQILDADGQIVGYNLLNASQHVDLDATQAGQVFLTEAQVAQINTVLTANDCAGDLVADTEPKFVVGYVETAEPHPDSDHLQITQARVDNDNLVQIVSGSPNMKAGLTVVVAKVGAMMPSGLIIWPGALRGVASNGMIVSGRELRLPNAPQQPGAMELPADFAPIGTPFDASSEAAQNLFAN